MFIIYIFVMIQKKKRKQAHESAQCLTEIMI